MKQAVPLNQSKNQKYIFLYLYIARPSFNVASALGLDSELGRNCGGKVGEMPRFLGSISEKSGQHLSPLDDNSTGIKLC